MCCYFRYRKIHEFKLCVRLAVKGRPFSMCSFADYVSSENFPDDLLALWVNIIR